LANFYKDYPTDPAYQSDGPMPDKFPPPVADKNGNRKVDADEFLDKMNQSTGRLSGGAKVGVANGGTFAGNTLENMAGTVSAINGSYNGNVVLYGTVANPIVIDGDVAINGDLVIKGYVKGTGRLYVRGNTYVIGDLQYADNGINTSGRTFGVAADGTKNLLAIASGGNVAVGDFVTKADGTTVDKGTTGQANMNFVSAEMAIFNRGEWTKTQRYLPNATGTLLPNANYVAGYVPRYYTLYPGEPVGIFMGDPVVDGSGNITGYTSSNVYWDAASNHWVGAEMTMNYVDLAIIPQNSPLIAGAAVNSLAPPSSWISVSQLRSLWAEDMNTRAYGDVMNVDGLLYTSNGTFELARKNSDVIGRLEIRGSLVSADIGILASGGNNLVGGGTPGTLIRYDERLANFLGVSDDGVEGIAVMRMTWKN
jgi:hypothetical protein